MSDVCPICGELLWIELGFKSEIEYEFQPWINYAYSFPREISILECDIIDEV